MTPTEPTCSPTGRYTTNETCAILDISRATLWRLTKAQSIKFGVRKCNGRKFFIGSDIIRLWRACY